jgi:hypothetical protein
MSQTLFNSQGTAVRPKCIDCGIELGNYSEWVDGKGPLCWICAEERRRVRISPERDRDSLLKETEG